MITLHSMGTWASLGVPEQSSLQPSSFQDTNIVRIDPPSPPLPQCNNSTSSQGRYTSLICWLWELELLIPDQEIRKGLITVKIHDMICSQFQLNSTDSEYIPGMMNGNVSRSRSNSNSNSDNNNTSNPSLNLTIHGVSTACIGKYKSGLTGGTVKVLVDNIDNEPIHIETAIISTIIEPPDSDIISIKFPSRANMTACESNLQVPKDGGISFTGSFSSKFVEMFSTSIAKHVTSTLNAQICPQVEKSVNEKLTGLIERIDVFLEGLIFGNMTNGDITNVTSSSVREGWHEMLVDKVASEDISSILDRKGDPILLPSGGEEDQSEITHTDTNDILSMSNIGVVRELDSVHRFEAIEKRKKSDENAMQRFSIANDTQVLQWKEVVILEKSIDALSSFVNNHLDEGILLDVLNRIGWFGRDQGSGCMDCGYFFRGINGLVRNITDNGQIQLDIHRDVDFVVQNLGRISLSFQNITINGLDTFTRIGVYPEAPYFLTPQVAMNDLELIIGTDLKVFPGEDTYIHGGPLEESFNIYVNASSLLLDLKAEIGVLKDELRDITMEDLFNGQIPFKTLKESVTRLVLSNSKSNISVDEMTIHPSQSSDSLEKSLDSMVNNVMDLILSEYDELVSRSLEAAFNGPGLDSINKALHTWLRGQIHEKDGLEDSRTGSDLQDFFHFNESKYVSTIHDFLSSQDLVSKSNSFVACISYFMRENPLIPTSALHKGMNVLMQNFSFQNFHLDNQGKTEYTGMDHLSSISAYTYHSPRLAPSDVNRYFEECRCQSLGIWA